MGKEQGFPFLKGGFGGMGAMLVGQIIALIVIALFYYVLLDAFGLTFFTGLLGFVVATFAGLWVPAYFYDMAC